MIRKKPKRYNSLDWAEFVRMTQKKYKKRFKKHIASKEIKKIWDDFVKYRILEEILAGNPVKIDKYSSMEIIGRPVLDDKKFFNLLISGKMITRSGGIKPAKMDIKRKEFKYKIIYKNSLMPDKELYFRANTKFAKKVREAINNTNTYYKIDYGNK